MRRRTLLGAMASAGIAAAAWSAWTQARLALAGAPVDARRLLATFRRPDSAAAVGRAYLARRPLEAELDRLVAAVSRDLRAGEADPAGLPRSELRRAIALQVRRDFAERRLAVVDGWILSRTEARLCGIAALLA